MSLVFVFILILIGLVLCIPMFFALFSLHIRQGQRKHKSLSDTALILFFCVSYFVGFLLLITGLLGRSISGVAYGAFVSIVVGVFLVPETIARNKRLLKDMSVQSSQGWAKKNGYSRKSTKGKSKDIILYHEDYRRGKHGKITSEINCVYSPGDKDWDYHCVLFGTISDLPYLVNVHRTRSGHYMVTDTKKTSVRWGEREVEKNVFRTDTHIVSKDVERGWEKLRRSYIEEFLSTLNGKGYSLYSEDCLGTHKQSDTQLMGYQRSWILRITSRTAPEKMLPFLDKQINLMYEISKS